MLYMILSIALAVLLVLMTTLYIREVKKIRRLAGHFGKALLDVHRDLEVSKLDYEALEKGRDEESEAYEQQFLSFMETIEYQSNAINSYIDDLVFLVTYARKHLDYCLPNVAAEAEALARIERLEAHILVTDG